MLWYPNIAALPLPAALSNAFQGLLPTYVYPFQFPVSTVDRSGPGASLIGLQPALLLLVLAAVVVILGYSAWVWRVALAERAALEGMPGPDDPAKDGGYAPAANVDAVPAPGAEPEAEPGEPAPRSDPGRD